MSCSEIINTWINEWTIYYNTFPNPGGIKYFLSPKIKAERGSKFDEFLDQVIQCAFIEYQGVRRIILKNKFSNKLDFTFSRDNYYSCPELRSLIDMLLDLRKEDKDEDDHRENFLSDSYSISISRLKQVIEEFNINFNLDEFIFISDAGYLIQEDRFYIKGDEYDYDAEHYYKESEYYEKINKKLCKYFKYEVAPYRKYNPGVDFESNINNNKYSYENIFNILTPDQIVKILTDSYNYSNKSWAEIKKISKEKIEYLKTRDTDTLKNFIEIIFGDDLVKDVVANAVSSLYGIIVE
jgi:hypothetical protein